MHQRETGCGSEEVFAKAMTWGKAHEEEALRYYSSMQMDIKSATYDFDEIVFVDDVLEGFGDSPDGCTDDHAYVG